MNQNLLSRITINPDLLVGKPTIRGMRISVELVLAALAGGVSMDEILLDYPDLELADIYAAIAYANKLVSETRVYSVA